jgi:hypothetical protein
MSGGLVLPDPLQDLIQSGPGLHILGSIAQLIDILHEPFFKRGCLFESSALDHDKSLSRAVGPMSAVFS